MTWKGTKFLAVYLLPAAASALIVWYWLTSTNPTVVVDQANTPFVTIAVLPDTLQESYTEMEPRGMWVLKYSIELTNRVATCQSLFIHKLVFGAGDPAPIANNGVVSQPIYPAPTDAQGIILRDKLQPGHYILLVEMQCFQNEAGSANLSTVLRPAAQAAPTCFEVTGREFSRRPQGSATLKAEDCTSMPTRGQL